MLFVFDNSMANVDASDLNHSRALEHILGAFQNQNHLVFIDLNDIRRINETTSQNLSTGSRAMLKTLYNRAPEFKALMQKIDYKIYVHLSLPNNQRIYRNGSCWHVSLNFLADSGLLQSAVIGENELDAELYCCFAKHYAKKHKFTGVVSKARRIGGGGSVTPRALKEYLDNELSPCLCITDSDKFHPNYQKSATSKQCEGVVKVRQRICEYFPLEEREVENILPIPLLEKISDVTRFCAEFQAIKNMKNNHWEYLDLKEGISLKWIREQDPDTKIFWARAQSFLEKKKSRCMSRCDSEKSNKEQCDCSLIDGLGKKILERAIKYLNENVDRLNLKLLNDDQRWEDIGKIVFDFTVAPARIL